MRRIWSSFALILAAGMAGCTGDDNGAGPDGSTRLSLLLTDAPGDVKAAVVTISEIYLQGGPGGRTTLLDDPVTVDLTDLANQTTQLLSDVDVQQGTYSELRFVLSGAYLEVETAGGSEIFASSPDYAGLPAGSTVDGQLQMPSLGSSGLKVNFDGNLEVTGDDQTLLIDFDVAQSFGHEAGNSGRWVMHPVVRGADVTAAASITVTLALGAGVTLPAGVVLSAFNAKIGAEEVGFTDTNSDGTFEATFSFLVPGTYSVSLVIPSGLSVTTSPVLPVDVTVAEGANVTQAVSITAISVIP